MAIDTITGGDLPDGEEQEGESHTRQQRRKTVETLAPRQVTTLFTDDLDEVPASAFGQWLAGLEKWGIVAILAVMAFLPTLEIVARRFFGTNIPGSVLYTQHLTLWVGFLGALLATAGVGKHLSLATADLLPNAPLRRAAKVYTTSLSAGVCALLAYASVILVRADSEQPRSLPGGVPEWVSELVMPMALGLMALRFIWRADDRWSGRVVALLATVGICMLGLLDNHASNLVLPGTIVILTGLILGAPLFVAMAGMAMLLFFANGTPIAAVPVETIRLVASPTLPAIPLLTVAGYVLAAGGASKRLFRFARALFGWLPGGMALMVCLVCAGFTTLTGGSGVTILALGGLVLPMLLAERYPEGFSLGLVTTSGSLGLLFPPCLPVILYAVVAQASVRDLFIAGFVPGLLLVLLVALYGVFVGMRARAPRQSFDAKEAGRSLWEAKWELAIPLIVVLSIFLGIATIVEAAAVAFVCAVISQCFIFKDLHPIQELPAVMNRAATLIGAVLIVLGVAMGLTSYLVEAEIPAAVLSWTRIHIHSPIVFLLALNAVLLVLGSILEIYSAIVILAPLLAPMAAAYGIDPLHLGIIFLANLELGFLFPPMGLNLILSSTRFNQPLVRLYKVVLPFLLIQAAGVLLITYVPAMTTGILNAVKTKSAQVEAQIPSPEKGGYRNDLQSASRLAIRGREIPCCQDDPARTGNPAIEFPRDGSGKPLRNIAHVPHSMRPSLKPKDSGLNQTERNQP